jgi:hypothetical protein
MIDVVLNEIELMVASHVGCMRRVSSIKSGYDKYKHAPISNWQTDIDGACAECAVAKALGIYWTPGVRTFKAPDVGVYQVRSTEYFEGHLIIRPNDRKDHETFVLVICSDVPVFHIIGSCLCGYAKQAHFWREDKNGWWVPQCELLEFTIEPQPQRQEAAE